ncbi:MAG: 16S rRNA processing protein RimM [Epsilonproteobacteria bacterium]|nr:16S rRNA processing protein RimM [Campylobacterota bacterium]
MKNKIPVAKLGKSFGVKGWQKFHNLSDFPEQFRAGAVFPSDKGSLTIEKIDLKKGIVKLQGIDSPEDAKKLTNTQLYTTEEETRENIKLKENEYFWFDIIGSNVYENGRLLGVVKNIERADVDYLLVFTDEKLVDEGYPKRFMLDFKRHIKDVDIENKKLSANGAIDILESIK